MASRLSARMSAIAALRSVTRSGSPSTVRNRICSARPAAPGTRGRSDMDDRPTMPQPATSAASVRTPSVDIYAPQWRNFIFVAPFLFFFTTLLLVPLLWGMWLSFHKADTFSSGNFVGLGNYIRLFHDKVFLQSVWNTFYFVLLTVPTLALIGLFLALCLNRRTRTAAVLRTLFFSSSVLSVTIVTLIWRIVFIPNVGLLSTIYAWFGATAPAF